MFLILNKYLFGYLFTVYSFNATCLLGCASPRGPAGDPLQERAEGEEPLQRGRLQDALAEVWGLPLCQGE
jgi:hypothetical protein